MSKDYHCRMIHCMVNSTVSDIHVYTIRNDYCNTWKKIIGIQRSSKTIKDKVFQTVNEDFETKIFGNVTQSFD